MRRRLLYGGLKRNGEGKSWSISKYRPKTCLWEHKKPRNPHVLSRILCLRCSSQHDQDMSHRFWCEGEKKWQQWHEPSGKQ
jgi:hypothetical protein